MIYPEYFTKEDVEEFEREYNAILDEEFEREVNAMIDETVADMAAEIERNREEIYSPYLGAL